jgi:diacylglycerol O-acyltransferase
MERLSGLDAAFLYLETPSLHMHVAMTAVFDPSTVPGGYSFDNMRQVVADRLHLVPPFRRRLVEVPFRLTHPLWIEDPDFDLDYHLRRVAVPSPGGPRELADLAGDICSRPLDRARPLWEMHVVEGLGGGNIGLVARMHHATIDGVSGAELMVHLFDFEPEPAPKPPPEQEWRPDRVPSDFDLLAQAIPELARRPVQLVRVARQTGQAAVGLLRRRQEKAAASATRPESGILNAPRTSFNVAITPHRKQAFCSLSLDEVKKVKNAFGVKVNDVVLAVCTGALRRYLDDRDELPDRPLVATVPISVHTEDSKGRPGNSVSAMFTTLPVQLADPVERLHAIADATRSAKETHNAVGADMLRNWAEFAPPSVFALAARLYSSRDLADRHRPIQNLVISNVPGPPFPLYVAGARLVGAYPMGPVMEGAGLNITCMSYIDKVDFGLHACREAVPDLWDMSDGLTGSLDELAKAAAAKNRG